MVRCRTMTGSHRCFDKSTDVNEHSFCLCKQPRRNFAQHYLAGTDSDISVTASGSLADAIEATNTLETLDSVVLDMQIPDMNGLQVLWDFR